MRCVGTSLTAPQLRIVLCIMCIQDLPVYFSEPFRTELLIEIATMHPPAMLAASTRTGQPKTCQFTIVSLLQVPFLGLCILCTS